MFIFSGAYFSRRLFLFQAALDSGGGPPDLISCAYFFPVLIFSGAYFSRCLFLFRATLDSGGGPPDLISGVYFLPVLIFPVLIFPALISPVLIFASGLYSFRLHGFSYFPGQTCQLSFSRLRPNLFWTPYCTSLIAPRQAFHAVIIR